MAVSGAEARTGWAGDPPASRQPATCRVGGCPAPATGTDGLCETHGAQQKRRRAEAERVGPAPAARDLAAAFDALADVVAAREAPWRRLAACRGRTDVMFPAMRSGGMAPDYGPAVELCAGCPVIEPCRVAGAREPAGMWGGTTPAERGKGRRRRSA